MKKTDIRRCNILKFELYLPSVFSDLGFQDDLDLV